MDRHLLLFAAVLSSTAVAQAQIAISPRAGLIHHAEGEVRVDGKPSDVNSGSFSHLKPGETLQTLDGRAELILTPAGILRADEATRFQLLSDDIDWVEVRLLEGSLIIDLRERPVESSIAVWLGESETRLTERGLYRLDAKPCGVSRLRVFNGLAAVVRGDIELHARSRQALVLDGVAATPEVFSRSDKDAFDEWNRQRDRVIAEHNRIAPYSNRRIVDGLAFLARRGQSGKRPPMDAGSPEGPGASPRRKFVRAQMGDCHSIGGFSENTLEVLKIRYGP